MCIRTATLIRPILFSILTWALSFPVGYVYLGLRSTASKASFFTPNSESIIISCTSGRDKFHWVYFIQYIPPSITFDEMLDMFCNIETQRLQLWWNSCCYIVSSCSIMINPFISHIFIFHTITGIFHVALKITRVNPFYKAGKRFTSYNLFVLCKYFERAIYYCQTVFLLM